MKYNKPHAETRLAEFLTKRVLELRPIKNQAEIASQAGFVNTNMLAMIKNGQTRLPLDRVSALAKGAAHQALQPVYRVRVMEVQIQLASSRCKLRFDIDNQRTTKGYHSCTHGSAIDFAK